MSKPARNTASAANWQNPDICWRAVIARDRSAVEKFILGVKTTGIYCRPACPARTPKRENVVFFPDTTAARIAGFRACKRCHPDDFAQSVRTTTLPASTLKIVTQLCRQLDIAETAPSASVLAAQVGWSEQHLNRAFKKITGLTLKRYAQASRAERLQQVLATSGGTTAITEVIYAAGYGSSSRFYAEANQTLGMPPRQFRAGGAGEKIFYQIVESPLGWLLVASTVVGVCTIALEDERAALLAVLKTRFPEAELIDDDLDYHDAVAKTLAYLQHPAASLDLPLDVQGTAFQRRVWQTLQQIPCGETVSYREVAEHLDKPTASRAVATACAANRVALAIPCHRVVRSGGKISGYRWGVARKKTLLDSEAKVNSSATQSS